MAKMTDAAKKKSETAIRKAYNVMDTASFTAGIAIEDLPANILITGVTVELLIGTFTTPSVIKISFKKAADEKAYKEKDLAKRYSVDEAKLKFVEIKDYQSTYTALEVRPIDAKTYFTIRLKK